MERLIFAGLCLMALCGCVHHRYDGERVSGPKVETKSLSKTIVSEHDLTIATEKIPFEIQVASYAVPVEEVEDAYVISHYKSYTGCSVMDYFPRYIPLRFLIEWFDYECEMGDSYVVNEREIDRTENRTIRSARTSVPVQGEVKVSVNGKPQGTLSLVGNSVRIDPYENLLIYWPASANELCVEHQGQKTCKTISAEQMAAIIKNTPQLPRLVALKDKFYEKCIEKNDVLSCNWAGTLYKLASPVDQKRVRNSFFRSCALSEANIGCSEAAAFGAANDVLDIMNKRAALAEAEAERQESERRAEAAERALEREEARLEREEELAEERLRQEQEDLDDAELRESFMESLKQATDQINESANRLRYGY